jgi:aspartate ammonia-lyase
LAAASGNLELNPFLPLIAHCLLESCRLLARGCDILRRLCVEGIVANEARCREHVETSTATATALVPVIGYEKATRLAKLATERRKSLKQTAIAEGMLTAQQFEESVSPEAVCRLGSPLVRREEKS